MPLSKFNSLSPPDATRTLRATTTSTCLGARGSPRAARHGLHRCLHGARAGLHDAVGGADSGSRRPGAPGQDALRRGLGLPGLAGRAGERAGGPEGSVGVLTDHGTASSSGPPSASSYRWPERWTSTAQVHHPKVFDELIDGLEPVKGPKGRPRKLHTSKGYDYERCRRFVHRRGIKARVARRGAESGRGPGRHRRFVERTLAWLSCCRRPYLRYERRADIHEAFLELGCALWCASIACEKA
jgi:hypothetical protein